MVEGEASRPAASQHEASRSSIRHYSLMNSLLRVVGSTERGSTENVLASYFLEHFDELPTLNVYDVAEACYTSRTGIRRFCLSIGLDNFKDLKSYAWEWGRHRDLFLGYVDHDEYRGHLRQSLLDMMDDVDALADDRLLDDLAACVHDAQEVVILTSDFSSMAVRQFQQAMLYQHKVVRIVTDSEGDVTQIAMLGDGDLLVVVSEHGGYARAVQASMPSSAAMRALVTVDCDEAVADTFDLVMRLSLTSRRGERSTYAQYGVSYLFDLLCNRYFVRYGK